MECTERVGEEAVGFELGTSRMGVGLRSKKMDILDGEKPHEQRCGWGGQWFLRGAGAQEVFGKEF